MILYDSSGNITFELVKCKCPKCNAIGLVKIGNSPGYECPFCKSLISKEFLEIQLLESIPNEQTKHDEEFLRRYT